MVPYCDKFLVPNSVTCCLWGGLYCEIFFRFVFLFSFYCFPNALLFIYYLLFVVFILNICILSLFNYVFLHFLFSIFILFSFLFTIVSCFFHWLLLLFS